MSQHKENILLQFQKLESFYQLDKSKTFQLKALRNAIRVISVFPGTYMSGGDLMKQCKEMNIKGIGQGIADRIDEVISTNTLDEFKLYETSISKNEVMHLFMSITGVGDKRANDWYEAGHRTIEDISREIGNGSLSTTHHINMGLKYYEDMKERIPRNEIDKMKVKLGKILKKIDRECVFEICGSYRRGQESSGDIDMIVSNPRFIRNIGEQHYLRRIVEECVGNKLIVDHLTENGDKKYMGFCRLNGRSKVRRIDIRVIDYESYWAGILYFTGNKEFNIKIRNRAIEKGYSLNEYGLTNNNGEKILLNSEDEIFELLEIPYKSPIERN